VASSSIQLLSILIENKVMDSRKRWPITAGRVGELPIKFDPKDFPTWNFIGYRSQGVDHLSIIWKDLECTNFLIDFAFRQICDLNDCVMDEEKEALRQQNMWIESLQTLNRGMYTQLFTITEIIKNEKDIPNSPVSQIPKNKAYCELRNRISDIRNHLISKPYQPDFYRSLTSCWSTESSGTDLKIRVKDKDGKKREVQFKPFVDAKVLHDFLHEALVNYIKP